MYVIAGLGNPKKEYENTRHNVGFAAVDLLAQRHGIRVNEARHRGLVGKGDDLRTESDSVKTSDLYEFKRRKHPGCDTIL